MYTRISNIGASKSLALLMINTSYHDDIRTYEKNHVDIIAHTSFASRYALSRFRNDACKIGEIALQL